MLDVLLQGKLLLSVAADAGRMDEVDRLLSQGVDVNAYGYVMEFGEVVEVNEC